jgi:hypothetical protein
MSHLFHTNCWSVRDRGYPDRLIRHKAVLGAVYTCDFAYDSVYDLVYDLPPNSIRQDIFYFFRLKWVDRPLLSMSDEELDPYLAGLQIVHKIVQGIVHGFVLLVADSAIHYDFWPG